MFDIQKGYGNFTIVVHDFSDHEDWVVSSEEQYDEALKTAAIQEKFYRNNFDVEVSIYNGYNKVYSKKVGGE
jgi:hypothetical protein